jgi:hypothetical protein
MASERKSPADWAWRATSSEMVSVMLVMECIRCREVVWRLWQVVDEVQAWTREYLACAARAKARSLEHQDGLELPQLRGHSTIRAED